MNYTFEDITNIILEYAKKHKMVHSVNKGDIRDISLDDMNTSIEYPFVFLQPNNITLNDNSTSFTYDMIVMNLVKEKQDNHIQVQSDMLNIAQDILYTLHLRHNEYHIQFPITGLTFIENYNDLLSGVSLTFTLEAPIDINACLLPFDE